MQNWFLYTWIPSWNIVHNSDIITAQDRAVSQAKYVINGDGKRVFKTTDVWIWMAEILLKLWQQWVIRWNVLDNGCGNGLLWTCSSLFSEVDKILFHDVSPCALSHSMHVARGNGIIDKSCFLEGDTPFFEDSPYIDFCVSNLPQNPYLSFCGSGWSELQIDVTRKIGKILFCWAALLTKSVSYADPIHHDCSIKSDFRIEKIGEAPCVNPNTGDTNERVEYFLCEKR